MLDRIIDEKMPMITSNHKQGGLLAANKLLENGCKNVLQITGMQSVNIPSHDRNTVFEAYLQERGVHVQTNAFDWSRFDFGYYLEYASKCLEEMPDLDGVFAADILAAAFVFVGRMKGKQIPQKLKVIAYDGVYSPFDSILSMTTIVQPVQEIAQRTVEMMMKLLDGEKLENPRSYLDVTLREGETTL